MPLKVAIITETLGTDDSRDSTRISNEAVKRGHKVFVISAKDISYSEGELIAKAYIYSAGNQPPEYLVINLATDVDLIHFRPNPPVDMGYLTTLYLLDRIKDKVLIINNPEAIIKFPEKIFPLQFAQFMPPTLITYNIDEIAEFANKHKEIVVKPIYEFGGNGIKKFKNTEIKTSRAELQKWLSELKTPAIVQQFLPNISKGDKRIYILNGEIEGAFNRVPKEGGFLANTIQGSTPCKTEITAREKEIIKALKPALLENGIFICGLDVIDGFVTEINITSPAGITSINNVYGLNLEARLWDLLEKKIV